MRREMLLPAIQAVQGGRETEEDLAVIRKTKANAVAYHVSVTWANYGEQEMQRAGITQDDARHIMEDAAIAATRRFCPPDDTEEGNAIRIWHAYTNKVMVCQLKKAIEKANCVSRYMAQYLLRIKKYGLDLFSSPDDELCAALSTLSKVRYPQKTLERVRAYFSMPGLTEQVTEPAYRESEEAKAALEKLEERLGEEDYRLFREFYWEPGTTVNALQQKYGLNPLTIRKDLARIRSVAESILRNGRQKWETSFSRYAKSHDNFDELFQLVSEE